MKRLALLLLLSPCAAFADPARVMAVEAIPTDSGWRFDVTLSHDDTGWDDYADGWRVELADGTVVGERPLAHPHVEEQPFTRSVSGVMIPEGTSQVYIRTRTNADGWDQATTPQALPIR